MARAAQDVRWRPLHPGPIHQRPSGTRSPGAGRGATSRMGRGLRRARLPALDELEAKACGMAIRRRRTVRHNRGTEVIEAGNIRFGLEMRVAGQGDGGMAIHVLGDIAGQEIELLAFDCFRIYPHYHYGPRYKNERIYLDKTLVPDPFAWVIDQFTSGRLPAMLTRAGYPTVAAALDEGVVASKLPEVEARAHAMLQA